MCAELTLLQRIKAAKAKSLTPVKTFATFLPIESIHQQFCLKEQEIALSIPDPPPAKAKESFSLNITLNAKQELASEYAEYGRSFVLTGAAGTGKTTALREIARKLLRSGKLGTHNFKEGNGPSIAFCAYTHVATGNMRKALHKDPQLEEELSHNILTIHKLLEFEPEFYEIQDESTGLWRTTMRFVPRRTRDNPLHLTHLIIEEASMVDAQGLWMKLFDALEPGCQVIFVGDINQLPPIFGSSVLNYALINLPVIELTEVYRQALESKIIVNAHRVLRGQALEPDGKEVKLISAPTGAKLASEHIIAIRLKNQLAKEFHTGLYDPLQDIVLTPFNKNDLGSININKHIAQFFGDHRKSPIWEIFAGMNRHYLAVGDKVLVNKQDGEIISISFNGRYFGKQPRAASENMTRHGVLIPKEGATNGNSTIEEDFELDYSSVDVDDISDKEKKNEASHIVTCKMENGEIVTLSEVGDFNPQVFSLGYCLTIHKAQGREWRRVFIVLHKNHAVLLFRELIYTALTRASKEVVIVDLCNQINKAIKAQRIKGDSTLEKIEWFNSKVSLEVPVPLQP